MNSRERILTAVARREPDRVPFDLGSTVVTGIHVRPSEALRSYLGLPARDTVIFDLIEQAAVVADDLADRLGVDARAVYANPPSTWRFEPREDGPYRYYTDEFQIRWRMPVEDGLYYDTASSPLAGDRTLEDVDRFAWPDATDAARFVGMRERAERIAYLEQRATVAPTIGSGLMDTAAFLRGFEDFYADLAGNPALACKLMDRVLEMKVAYWSKVIDECGPALDFVCEGDDLGTERGPLMSPRTYRSLVKPRHRELLDYIHSRGVKVLFHSCGGIRPLIGDLIEVGVDALNPVQVSAAGMDSAELKAEFGRELAFWGGGADTQRVLGVGTEADVRAEVRRRLDDFMPDGGFVFNAVHNIQANVPPEHVMAMWETVREYGDYGT
jgi:uroporphyrinogen decarboxylase